MRLHVFLAWCCGCIQGLPPSAADHIQSTTQIRLSYDSHHHPPQPTDRMQAQNMSSISFRSMQDRRVLTSTGGNTNRSSLSVGEGSPRATITCTTPGSSKVAHRRSAQKHTEQECMKQKEKDETMLEEPVKENRQKKRTTWRVETFCRCVVIGGNVGSLRVIMICNLYPFFSFSLYRIKPQVNSSSPSAKHFRSIPYELRHGQGRTYSFYLWVE